MQPIVEKLVKLQEVLREIWQYERHNRDLPRAVASLRAQFEPHKRALELKRRQLDAETVRVTRLETDHGLIADKTKQIDERVGQIATEKEYNAFSSEQEYLAGEQGRIEGDLAAAKSRAESLAREVAELDAECTAMEGRIAEEEAKIASKVAENEAVIADLKGKSEAMSPEIDRVVLSRFQKVLNSKDGTAIVRIVGKSCDGCHMEVPPQLVAEVKRSDKLLTCLHCNRFLYVEE